MSHAALGTNASLVNERSLHSRDGRWHLKMQQDGNLVLYDRSNTAIWHTHTFGKGQAPFRLDMQSDGNLVGTLS
jgi:hypothetical protein